MKKFVALSPINADYTFMTSSAFYVTPKRAAAVAAALNEQKYKHLPGVIWKVFDDDGEFTARPLYRGVIRKNKISLYEIDY